MRERAAWRAVTCLVLVLLAACSGDDDKNAPPSATVPTAPAQTTTTDPYAVPAVIDIAYVNRVLAGLDAALGDVIRLVVTTKSVPQEAIDRLKAIYVDSELVQLRIDSFQSDLRTGLKNYKPAPGNRETRVMELITIRPSCVYARVSIDASAVAVTSDPRLSTQWVAIRPAGSRTAIYNPTGWVFTYEGFQRDLSAPSTDPCATA